MSLQSVQDLLAMATGFPATENPEEHEEEIEEFGDHAEAVVHITPPETILQKVFLKD
jgi:hypothetical protein